MPFPRRLRPADSPTLPRPLHPGAWWLWALGLAAAASRTTNPVLLVLLVAVAGYVVAARRSDAPWGGSYVAFVRIALLVVAIRVVFQAVFGAGVAGRTTLFTLPVVPLPDWFGGLRIGGPVTLEAVAAAAYDGMHLAAVLVCVGAANALGDAKRLLRSVPGALYELGVSVVVAMTFAPQLLVDASRARNALRLRGRPARGLRSLRATAVPVLEGALARSVSLAAAMDSRGYGRTTGVAMRARRIAATLVVVGLLGICVGLYGLLDAGSPTLLGLPSLLAGVAAGVAGLTIGGRRVARTRYRPDPWALPEWLVVASGAVCAAAFWWASSAGVDGILVQTVPLTFPAIPVVPFLGGLIALAPAWVSPPLPRTPEPPAARPTPARTSGAAAATATRASQAAR